MTKYDVTEKDAYKEGFENALGTGVVKNEGTKLAKENLAVTQKNAAESLAAFAPFLSAGEPAINPLLQLATNQEAQTDFIRNNPLSRDALQRSFGSGQMSVGNIGSNEATGNIQDRLELQSRPLLIDQVNRSQIPVNIGLRGAAQSGEVLGNQSVNTTDINRNMTSIIGDSINNQVAADIASKNNRANNVEQSLSLATAFLSSDAPQSWFSTGSPGGPSINTFGSGSVGGSGILDNQSGFEVTA